MIPHLPDEVWLKILQHVSLHHRLEYVQFVNSRFNRLCRDRSLDAALNVSNGLRMPERKCLALITRVSQWLQVISFEDCHWLSGSFFAKMPLFPLLTSVNFGPCYLLPKQLYEFASCCPELQNLVVHLAIDDAVPLHDMRFNYPDNWPFKKLKRLHIILTTTYDSVTPAAKYLKQLYHTFFSSWGVIPYSFSIQESPHCLLRKNFYLSREVINLSQPCFRRITDDDDDTEQFCEVASNIGMHSQKYSIAAQNALDYDEVTFLVLPTISRYANTCTGKVTCPHQLSALKYLGVSETDEDGIYGYCENIISKKIFLESNCENLKCLRFSSSNSLQLDQLYARLPHFLKLKELILESSTLNLNQLMKCLETLKDINSLSVSVNKSVYEPVHGEAQCDGYEFLSNLAEMYPQMKKLALFIVMKDHSNDSRVLKPLKRFENLEILEVDGFDIMNSLKFSKILRHLKNLKTLTLITQNGENSCDFDIFLRDSLHLLPKLSELHFHHKQICYFNVLQNCPRCTMLEKLVIKSSTDLSRGALSGLKQCVTDLPNLDMVAIICNSVAKEMKDEIQMLQKWRKSSRKQSVQIYCGNSEHTPREYYSLVFSNGFQSHQPYQYW